MKLSASFIALLLFVSIGLNAQQTGKISGKVTDETGQAVEFANTLLLSPEDSSLVKGALTDSSGAFVFERIPYGTYLISVSFVGYSTFFSPQVSLSQQQPQVEIAPLQLGQSSVQLSEVVVKAERPFIELQADKMVINVENSPVSAGSTALEILARSPGIIADQNQNLSLKGRQGVLILINGKNTHLSVQDVVKMLETMPADQIRKIEIVHSPSAKYEASGNAGVINIQLKKDSKLGLNASLMTQAGMGRYPKVGAGGRFNYRQEKFNVFGDYNYWDNQRFQEINLFRTLTTENGLASFDQFNREVNTEGSHWAKGGIDWFAGKNTTLGLFVRSQIGSRDQEAFNRTLLGGANQQPFQLVDAGRTGDDNWNNHAFNFNLEHRFGKEGQSLSFDADYSTYDNTDIQDYDNRFLDAEGNEAAAPNILHSDNISKVDIKAVKLDFTRPLGEKGRLEAGSKLSSVSTDNSILFLQQQDGSWLTDSSRTNQFLYEEHIMAGYLNASRQLGGFHLQLGLRAEYTQSDGLSVTLNERTKRDYLDFFPSASLSHQLGDHHSLSYSYSRRIDRPNYQDLNPFIYFLDQYTFLKGNPLLRPQYSNSYNLNYGFKQRYFLTLSYTRTNQVMAQVLEQDAAELATFQVTRNLDRFDNYSLNFSAPVVLAEWWTARFNLSAFYNQFESVLTDEVIDNEQFTYSFYTSQNFTLPEGFKAELSGHYQSRMAYSFFDIKPQYAVDFGLSKSFLDGRADVNLSVNDIFNIRENNVDIVQGDINVQVKNKWESQRVMLKFNYRFGNAEVKPARRRSTATEEEQNRVKGN